MDSQQHLMRCQVRARKKFVITTMPSENDLYDFATLNNLNPNDLILNSGEEYEIVATTNKSNLSKIKKPCKKNTELRSMRLVMSQRVWVYFTKKMENWLESKMGGWQHLQKTLIVMTCEYVF